MATIGEMIKIGQQAVVRLMGVNLIALLSLSVQAAPAPTQQQTLQKAEAALQQQDYQTTIEILTPLHLAEPANLIVGNNLAVAYIRQQRYEQAQQVLETVLNKIPKIATLRNNLQQIYAYQAQLAYQNVFNADEISQPKGEWILFANYDIDPAEVAALKQVKRDIAEVTQQLETWRSAWSEQNLSVYLASYQSDYYDEDFQNRQAWEKNRQFSVKGPRYIQIQLQDISVVPIAKEVIQVQFWQAYESNRFKDRVRKKLLWQKSPQGWKIMKEAVIYE
ncbi:hypothetical protein CYQ88_05730 [Hydrogenovibrio sp. SC-1]|uniref:nuclear transport factor 2 family protein n=1 Tax=Hydrogenovibrio sp. SC-1 TaxID=2065820 RepID=UPI000C797372|nr:tetratricopeptide repeat protein [Hydrogenovibrio sp. SC-1]PLA74579.1 hypothetical protein CYQ88_05730 [Hydrogenovibrio sp. SC-1]